ncbi:glycosyltransferase [Ideonella sp. DXS29W]|uniref:Glycosyltransferase n=1 Tax=Ideonella lacteola TaxID=2984193 RepID=A0ABU9BSM4_9BURK
MTEATLRQRQRAQAHAMLDAEASPGAGARAAGLSAAAERFDDLAWDLLTRVDAGHRDAVVEATLQLLAWRMGISLGELKDPDIAAMPAAQAVDLARDWVETAFECAWPLAALSVVESAGPHVDEISAWRGLVRGYLAKLGQVVVPDGTGISDAALLLVCALPTGLKPSQALAGDLPLDTSGEDLASLHGGRSRSIWWSIVASARGRPAQGLVLAHLAGHAGRLPVLPQGSLVLLNRGHLNRYTARHWIEALAAWPEIIVSGLRVNDPAVASGDLIQALQRHQPIAVDDVSSLLLLREWGIDAVLDGVQRHPAPLSARDGWARGPVAQAEQGWWAHLAGWMANQSAPSGSAVKAEWLHWLQDARARRKPLDVRAWTLPLPHPIESMLTNVSSRRIAQVASGEAEVIEVALAVDEELAEFLPVVIESCLEHATQPLRFHVLARHIGEPTLRDWQRLFDRRAEVIVYDFAGVSYGGQLHLISHTTVSTLDRLTLPLLLPKCRRVIYLDIDLVVLGDLAPMWQLDLAGCPLAAKPSSSPGMRWGTQMLYRALGALDTVSAQGARQWLHETGPMAFRTFNAGVLLLDLERMRQDGAVPTLLSFVEHCGMNDQDALNAYTRHCYLPLAPEWNAAPRQDLTQGARIIHFVGPVKPWHDLYISRKPEFDRVRARLRARREEP